MFVFLVFVEEEDEEEEGRRRGTPNQATDKKRVALRRLSIITSLDVGEEWVWMNVYLS